MKKIILIIFCIVPGILFAQEGKFTIKGKTGKLNPSAKAYLIYKLNGEDVADSCMIKNNAFTFSGTVKQPVRAALMFSHNGKALNLDNRPDDYLSLMLEAVTFNVTTKDSIKNANITGSPVNDDNKILTEMLKPSTEEMNKLILEMQSASDEQKNSEEFQMRIEQEYESIMTTQSQTYKFFMESYPDSYMSLLSINNYARTAQANAIQLEWAYDILSPRLKNTEEGQAIAKRITGMKNTEIGATAPDFTQNNPDGKPIKLSDFRGKYLLVDFWASWCGPCRKENPNVVKAYNEFKNKNFEILGVSLDNNKESWVKAIEKDGLNWPQVSDLGSWKNEVALMYVVQSIPQNFLLDPEGKIIAKNLRGEELSEKLAELIK